VGVESSAGDFTLMGFTYMVDLCYCSITFLRSHILPFSRSYCSSISECSKTTSERTLPGAERRSYMAVSDTVGTIRLLNSLLQDGTKFKFLNPLQPSGHLVNHQV
jgi:hypothetical protein